MKKLALTAIRVRSFLTSETADRLTGGAAAFDEKFVGIDTHNSHGRDCETDPILCPP